MNRTLLSLLSLVALLPLAAHAADPTFVPLTSIPALQNVSQADGLSNFLNQIYILCVGAAAVLAVIQLTRAGIMYALTDTGVTEKREARHLMVMSVLGLLLVLSPTIVFGIINPDILKLTINTGVLRPAAPSMTREFNVNPGKFIFSYGYYCDPFRRTGGYAIRVKEYGTAAECETAQDEKIQGTKTEILAECYQVSEAKVSYTAPTQEVCNQEDE